MDVLDPTTGRVTQAFVDAVREALEAIELQELHAESKVAAEGTAKMLEARGISPDASRDGTAIREFLQNARKPR